MEIDRKWICPMAIIVSSKASSPIYVCPYHVFLSTKRADSCENFIDKLYSTLLHSGIHTFRNYDKHERGEGFSVEIRKAVEQSKVSIIIFSENYALSKWCLDELVNLVERKEKESHVILPVFYDVDPSHIRKQKGSYENAFFEYERKEGITRVQRWRAALKDVANLAGIVLKNGREFELIQDIVERTWIKLSRTVFKVAPYLVGIYSRVKNISSWLQDGLNNNPISVIHGTGGIGKTTLAKILYHLHHAKFEISSFIPNIKEFTNRRNGLLYLQKHILSDILKEENVDVNDVQQGFLKIKKALYCKTFFLVLDDVDKLDQLNVVLDLRDWFSAGSKIMITTRDEKLLNSQNNCFSYPAKELDFDEAIQLFSFHAFQRDNPTNGFMDLSKELVNLCQGLPLALQVLGSSLLNATKDMWEITLRKLSEISDSQIIKILEVGYDNLHDDLEKNLFLDVACFFVGMDKDYVVTVLDECDLYARAGIEKLIDICFLKLNQLGKLEMHELIREMCRKVIREESHGELGKYSRLWDSGNALNVLGEKRGTELVECLNLDLLEVQNHDYLMQSLKGNPIRRHGCIFFSCLPLTSSSASVTMSSTEGLNADVFSRLTDLRLLHLSNVQLFGSYERFPKKLKWLCWHNFKSKSLPCDFPMEHLSVLEMHNSNLERVWEGTQILRSLKVLDLSHSHCLTRTPDFSYFPCLKRLVLEDCVNLVKIHESIGQLYGLVLLNLRGCENLRKLPKEIQRLKSLRALYLSGCLNLDFSESSSMLEFLPRSL